MALGGSITQNEIKTALGETSNSAEVLCTSSKINVWSKWKPIHMNVDAMTYALLRGANFGISIISATNLTNLLSQVQNNNGLGYTYSAPRGGASSPYREGDFRYYNPDAGLPIHAHYRDGDSEKIGSVSSTYSVTIDGIETIDTGSDSTETSMTAGIGRGDLYASSLKRGCLLTDGSNTVWSVGTIPYGQTQWQALKGKTVTCLEFLCNLSDGDNSINHTANAADRYYALPEGLHTISLLNQTPSGSKDAYCVGRCTLSTDRKSVSYRLAFSAVGDAYAGGTLSNVWFVLSDDYNGNNRISQYKVADSLSVPNETTTSYYTGILSSPTAMSQVYLLVLWDGTVKWRTTPMEIIDPY